MEEAINTGRQLTLSEEEVSKFWHHSQKPFFEFLPDQEEEEDTKLNAEIETKKVNLGYGYTC